MEMNVTAEVAALKRIAWRQQVLAEGDLSDRARRRADELARDADLRTTLPMTRNPVVAAAPEPEPSPQVDPRLSPPGSVLTRAYKGGTVQVKVLADGFEYRGRVYGSLSAAAKAVTGSHCNGFLFFRVTCQGGDQ